MPYSVTILLQAQSTITSTINHAMAQTGILEGVIKVFGHVEPSTVVAFVFFGLIALFLLGATGIILRSIVPGLMTTLGIFGTFWGIFIALVPLDLANLHDQDNIPALLKGMTTAFTTSLLGLLCAIVTKTVWSTKRFISNDAKTAQENLAYRLDEIKFALSGKNSDDDSVLSQLKGLREESAAGFNSIMGLASTIENTLIKSLDSMTHEIREVVGKQLANSLKELIANIEQALIKQFGATFVQFNEAVQALKKWQEDHRLQVEQLTEAFEKTATGIEGIRSACAELPDTAEKLREITANAQDPIRELNEQMVAFASLRQQAEEAFPVIKQNLDQIGEDLKSSADSFDGLETTIRAVFENSKQTAEAHANNVDSLVATMKESISEAVTKIMQDATDLTNQHAANVNELAKSMQHNLDEAIEKVASTTSTASNRLVQQVEALVGSTMQKVTTSLEALIVHATALSTAHSETVQSLVANMRQTMEQAQEDVSLEVQAIIEKSVRELEEQTTEELTRVTNTWGNSVVSVAEALAKEFDDVKSSRSQHS